VINVPIKLTDFDNAFTLIHKTTKYGKEELTDEDIVEIRTAVKELIATNVVFSFSRGVEGTDPPLQTKAKVKIVPTTDKTLVGSQTTVLAGSVMRTQTTDANRWDGRDDFVSEKIGDKALTDTEDNTHHELIDDVLLESMNRAGTFILGSPIQAPTEFNTFGKNVQEIQDWLDDEDAIRNGTTLGKYDPATAAINTIGRAALESDAEDITIATLERAGVTEAIDDNLEEYREVISGADDGQLGTLDQINTLVLGVNNDDA